MGLACGRQSPASSSQGPKRSQPVPCLFSHSIPLTSLCFSVSRGHDPQGMFSEFRPGWPQACLYPRQGGSQCPWAVTFGMGIRATAK